MAAVRLRGCKRTPSPLVGGGNAFLEKLVDIIMALFFVQALNLNSTHGVPTAAEANKTYTKMVLLIKVSLVSRRWANAKKKDE